ncbi:MAG TPA: DegV family protein [Firmicutes bacterium]|nr:DegV family protein [Bacillota bacterium]
MDTNIKLFTDSAADLPAEYKAKYEIEVVPLSVIFGTEEFKDQVTLSVEQFWQRMSHSRQLPSTNQVNPHDFVEAFRPFLARAYTILYVGLSSRLSGTLQSAVIAKELLKSESIHVFDSRSASIGETLLLLRAAELVEAGCSVREILPQLGKQRKQSFAHFTIDSLTHLVRGGRLTKTQGFLGSMLNIRPILHITPEGTIEPSEKVRSTKKALQTIVRKAQEHHIDFSNKRVAVMHTYGADTMVDQLMELVQEYLAPKEVIQGLIGPTIGAHTGPGGIALFF